MKRLLAILIFAVGASSGTFAQDDDVYFVPTKAQKAAEAKKLQERQQRRLQSDYEYIEGQGSAAGIYHDNGSSWAEGRVGQRNVDEYNRRQAVPDTACVSNSDCDEDGEYTSRLVRFHSPRVGVVVSSPYYSLWTDYYNPWLTPWDADFYYDDRYGWGWQPYYYHSPFYWRYGWYDPWWSYTWGWQPGWHDHWHGGWGPKPNDGRFIDTSRRVTSYRPSRNYAGGGRYLSNNGYRPSRSSYQPSNAKDGRLIRNYGNSNGVNASRTDYRPSRSFGNGTPSRSTITSPSMPSRSFGNGGGGGRSFGNGGGGGRSFGNGGGGGRSFGGRR